MQLKSPNFSIVGTTLTIGHALTLRLVIVDDEAVERVTRDRNHWVLFPTSQNMRR